MKLFLQCNDEFLRCQCLCSGQSEKNNVFWPIAWIEIRTATIRTSRKKFTQCIQRVPFASTQAFLELAFESEGVEEYWKWHWSIPFLHSIVPPRDDCYSPQMERGRRAHVRALRCCSQRRWHLVTNKHLVAWRPLSYVGCICWWYSVGLPWDGRCLRRSFVCGRREKVSWIWKWRQWQRLSVSHKCIMPKESRMENDHFVPSRSDQPKCMMVCITTTTDCICCKYFSGPFFWHSQTLRAEETHPTFNSFSRKNAFFNGAAIILYIWNRIVCTCVPFLALLR